MGVGAEEVDGFFAWVEVAVESLKDCLLLGVAADGDHDLFAAGKALGGDRYAPAFAWPFDGGEVLVALAADQRAMRK